MPPSELHSLESAPSIAPAISIPRPQSDISQPSQAVETSCSTETLTEVRWLAHQLRDGVSCTAAEGDVAWRLLGLLQELDGFHTALAPLRPRARREAVLRLKVRSLRPEVLVPEDQGVACLVLWGSLQLLGAAPGQELELPAGGELPPCRAACGVKGAELLVLTEQHLEEAKEVEERREATRSAAIQVLQRTERMCRGVADLKVLRDYLETLELFQVEEEKLLRLCQHLQLLSREPGQSVLGASPDGLRLLLRGVAAVGQADGVPLWCHEAWFCADDLLWPWELLLQGRRPMDLVAVEPCDVLFLPRGECAALAVNSDMARRAFRAVAALPNRPCEQAVLSRRALLVPESALVQAQEELWAEVRAREAAERVQQPVLPTPEASRSVRQIPSPGAGDVSGSNSLIVGSSSFRSQGLEFGLMRMPSCELEEEEPENEWRYQCYGAILEWAEAMMRYLLPGISGDLRPVLPLLPRQRLRLRLLRLAPGELMRGGEGIRVLLSGLMGRFEAGREALPPGLLSAVPRAVQRLGLESIKEAQEWLLQLSQQRVQGGDLAPALVQVTQRRLQELRCPGESHVFVSSAFLERKLLGERAVWLQEDLTRLRSPGSAALEVPGEVYVDVSQLGALDRIYRSGERVVEAVALRSADVLVVEPEGPEEMPSASSPSGLVCRLLQRTEAFSGLECKALRRICRGVRRQRLEPGQRVCRENDVAEGFFHILKGTASAWASEQFLMELAEGSAVGEDVLRGEERWAYSVVAETGLEIAWVDQQLYREACLDLSGERAARRRVLEAFDAGRRLAELPEAELMPLLALKVPLIQDCDQELKLEVMKQATMLHTPAGGHLPEMEDESPPLHIILKGAVGRYALELPQETGHEDGHVPQATVVEHGDKQRQQEYTAQKRRYLKAKEELVDLQHRLRMAPLECSMQESLRMHFLAKLVAEFVPEPPEELAREPEERKPAAPAEPEPLGAGVFLTETLRIDQEPQAEMEAEFYEGDSLDQKGRYVAQEDCVTLQLRREHLQEARQLCERRRADRRGEFLRRCLGEDASKLLLLFKEERCYQGQVLVKGGSMAQSLMLLYQGRCSQVREADPRRRIRRSLGLLQEGQFIGLTSFLLQQAEPLTVFCASEVVLLRAEHLSVAKLTPRVVEVLKHLLEEKSSWLNQRLETLRELPSQLDAKAEKLRSELYRSRVPLVSDSPFLRRKHQALFPGMVALEAVCKHFGNEVHPESEWIYMQKERDFFMHMQLSSGFSEPLPKAELPEHGKKTLEAITAPSTANARFAHHQPLVWKKLRFDTEEAPPRSAGGCEGGSRRHPVAKDTAVPEVEDLQPEVHRPVSPEDTLRRRPHIILSSNSRVFQNCSTEVCINERRAVKEAKSTVSAAIREPLVTPRGQGQSCSMAKRAWQKGFAFAALTAHGCAPSEERSEAKEKERPVTRAPEGRPREAEAPKRPPASRQGSGGFRRRLLTSQTSRESRTESRTECTDELSYELRIVP